MRRSAVVFLVGILVGAVGLFLLQTLAASPDAPITPPTSVSQGDVRLTVRNAYLQRMAVDEIQKLGLPVTLQNVRIEARGNDQMALVGEARAYGVSLPASLTLQPSIVDGQLKMRVTGISVESVPVPAEIGKQIEDGINARLGQFQSGLPYRMVGVGVTADGLVLDATAAK